MSSPPRSPDLQSEGDHGPILVHVDPGTGDPAHAPGIGVITHRAHARRSAGRERRRERDGRKVFHQLRARQSAVSHHLFIIHYLLSAHSVLLCRKTFSYIL